MTEKLDPEAKRLMGKLKPDAFRLVPDSAHPVNLQLVCSNRRCNFSRAPELPVLTVDEPIYRRRSSGLRASAFRIGDFPAQASLRAP